MTQVSHRLRPEDWAFSSGSVAVAETRLLTNDEFLDLLRLPTLQALIQRVKQVETYVNMPAGDSPESATRTVEREYIAVARKFGAEAPDTIVVDLMLARYLFAELRAFIRSRLFPKQEEKPSFSALSEDALDALWEGAFDAREDLAAVVQRLRRALEGEGDARERLDLLVDREELIYFRDRARATHSDFIAAWADKFVQLTAALTVIRARLSGAEPERLRNAFLAPPLDDTWLLELAEEDAKRLAETLGRRFRPVEGEIMEVSRAAAGKIARMMDDRLTLDATPAKFVTFGPERLFGYLRGLHVENLNLRLITETFVVEGSRDETRGRLRMSYA